MMITTITCPECKGQRTRTYIDWPHFEISDEPGLPPAPVQAVHENCRKCGGKGWVRPTGPIPVIQQGRRVGTVPPSFDPDRLRSTSWLYDIRPGDFIQEGDTWIASPSLGWGDLQAVPGFKRYER